MKKSTGWLPEADSVDRPDGQDEAESADDCFWDKATIVGKAPVTLFDDYEVRISPIATC